jgi:hypothetical protein
MKLCKMTAQQIRRKKAQEIFGVGASGNCCLATALAFTGIYPLCCCRQMRGGQTESSCASGHQGLCAPACRSEVADGAV